MKNLGTEPPLSDDEAQRLTADLNYAIKKIEQANVSVGFMAFISGVLITTIFTIGFFVMFTDQSVKIRCKLLGSGAKLCGSEASSVTAEQGELEVKIVNEAPDALTGFTAHVSKEELAGNSELSDRVALFAAVAHNGDTTTYTTLLELGGRDAFRSWVIPVDGSPLVVDYVDENGAVIVYNVAVYFKTSTTSYADWPNGMTKEEVNALPDGGRFRKKRPTT